MHRSDSNRFSIFYGYPPELVAQWCGVTLATARRWKKGAPVPRPALRLFTLYRDMRVLDAAWAGWKVHKGKIIDPDGNATTETQLRAYSLVMQFAADLARRDPATAKEFHRLLKRA